MKIKIGMSQTDITPPARVLLQGQVYTRISETVESPLTAQVFAVQSADAVLVL